MRQLELLEWKKGIGAIKKEGGLGGGVPKKTF